MLGASWRSVAGTGWVAAAILVAGFGVSLAANWPGHLSYDSVIQLLEGRTGVYGGWHPPVMSWLLGVFDALVPGTGLFILLDTALLYGSLLGLLSLRMRPDWTAPALAALLVVTPQFLVYPGIVWKDVLFAAAAVAGFTLLAIAAARWPDRRVRFATLPGACVLLCLAALTRQNGIVLVPFAALALGWIAARHASNRRLMQAALYFFGALLSVVVGVVAGEAALELRGNGQSSPLAQVRLLQTYDLAGALSADPTLDLDQIHDDDPKLEAILREEAAPRYTPASEEPLANLAPLQKELANVDDETVPLQWRQFIEAHPFQYLTLRWAVFRWVFFTPDIVFCRPALSGISGPADVMAKLHLAPRMDARDKFLGHYVMAFAGTPVLSHVFFALAAVLVLVLLLRRRAPADLAIAALIGGAFAFTASFFFISLVCDYRYLYPLDAASMVALFYAAVTFGWREQP